MDVADETDVTDSAHETDGKGETDDSDELKQRMKRVSPKNPM